MFKLKTAALTHCFILADVFMNLVCFFVVFYRSAVSEHHLCTLPQPLTVMTENNRAVSCQAISTTTGPHQLITSRNHVLTDGPMHIDRRPALPRSKSPNANESFSVWERRGGERKKGIGLLFGVVPTLHKACIVITHTHQPKLSQDCSYTHLAAVRTPFLCASSFCLSPAIFLTSAVSPCALHGSYFSWR